jgi:hypothetical protein
VELLVPKAEAVFQILLQHDLRLLRSMIEAVIHLPAPIEKLIVINPELPSNLAADKVIRLDVRVILINKCRIDLEIQWGAAGARSRKTANVGRKSRHFLMSTG